MHSLEHGRDIMRPVAVGPGALFGRIMRLLLNRWGYTPAGTFGTLTADEKTFCTIERPWLNNEPQVSCVPEGLYRLEWHGTTTSVPDTFNSHTWYLVGGTVGFSQGHRTRCAVHIANTMKDVKGCVGVALGLGFSGSIWQVNKSRLGMQLLLDEIGAVDHEVLIYRGTADVPQ